jgi:hypothetical protein
LQISKYFASLGFDIDKASVKRVDTAINRLEARLKSFGNIANKPITLSLGKFDVDQRRLNLALGTALDIASARTTFQISRFVVDQNYLNRAMVAATTQASRVASQSATIRPNVHAQGAGVTGRHAAVAGGIAGGISRLYGPALALGLGGYGLGALNQRNQQVVSAQLQSSAVVQQAGGTAEQGQASFEYLRSEGNRIGFNYLDASQDYNKLISGLTGAGFGVKDSQKVFSGFAELSRVNKLDKVTQNRLFRALSQVAGKDQLMAEELTGQIAEALPGGVALFAQAYKRQTGQDLGLGDVSANSSADIKRLLAATKNREVRGEILIAAGQIASERANKGGALTAASTASQAEQARYQNTVNDLAVVASNSGVEEGFARIFRTLNGGLSESNGLVRTLSEQFNEATKFADDLLLFPQSFIRALEGKDSLVADFLGIEQTSQLIEDWKTIQGLFTSIGSIKFDFLPTLEATAREIAAIINTIAEFQNWKNNLLASPSQQQDVSFIDRPITATYQTLGRLFGGTGDAIDRSQERGNAVYGNPDSAFYQNPSDYDDNLKNMLADLANQQKSQSLTTSVSLTISVDPITLANMDVAAQAEDLGNRLVTMFEQVNVNFPVGE